MRRILRILAWTVATVVLLVFAVYLLRGPIFGGLIADTVTDALADELGGRYSIVGVEGEWLSGLALVGLRTEEAPPTGPLTKLQFGRAVVTYDLWELFSDDPMAAIHSVSVSHARVDVDLTRPPAEPRDEEPGAPLRLPPFDVSGEVFVRAEQGAVALEGLSLRGDAGSVDAEVKRVVLPELFGEQRTGEFAGRLLREADGGWVWSSSSSLAGIGVPRLRYAPDGAVDAVVAVAEGAITIAARGGEAEVRGNNIALARLPAWVHGLLPASVAPPDAGRLRVDLHAAFDPLAVSGELTFDGVSWDEARIDQAVLQCAYADGRATVSAAHIESSDVRLEAADVQLEFERPYLIAAARRLELDVADVRPWVPRLDRRVSVRLLAHSERERELLVDELSITARGMTYAGAGRAELPEDPARWRETRVRYDFAGRLEDFRTGDYAMEGRVAVTGQVTGALETLLVEGAVKGRDVVVDGRRIQRLDVEAQLRWPELTLGTLALETQAGAVHASGRGDLERRVVHEASYRIEVPDLANFAKLFPRAPVLGGTVSGSGTMTYGEAGLRGVATLHAEDVVLDGEDLGALDVEVRARESEISVEELRVRGPWGVAAGRGVVRVDKRWARIDVLAFESGRREGALRAPALLSWTADAVEINGIFLETLGGRITGSVRRGEEWDIALRGREIELAQVDDRFEGRVAFLLKAKDDAFDVELDAPRLAFEGYAGEVEVKAHQDDTGLRVERLRLQIGRALDVVGTADLPWRFTRAGVERVENQAPRIEVTRGFVRDVSRFVPYGDAGSVSFSVYGDRAGLQVTAQVRDLQPVEQLVFRGDTWVQATVGRDRIDATVVAEHNRVGDLAAVVSADRGIDWTRPVEFRRWLDEANVEGRVELAVPDLDRLRRLFPALLHAAGECDLSLRFKGPARAPTLEGSLEVVGLECKLPGEIPPITNGRGKIVLQDRTLAVQGLHFDLGYAEAGVAGTVRWRDEGAPALDLTLAGENVLLVRDRYLRLRADVDVALVGDLDAPIATGKVRITDALYSAPLNPLASEPPDVEEEFQLFSVREGVFARMAYDIAVTADRTFRIRNKVVRGDLSFDLTLRGTGRVPEPVGRVFFRDTLVDLPLSSLKVDTGELRFAAENPFRPHVHAQAHTRMRGYDLDVKLFGQLPTVDVYVTARPSLSPEDAILLLTTGSTRAEIERDPEAAVINKVGVLFGEKIISAVSGPRDPDASSFLDRFDFEVGRDVSRSGLETVEGEFEITRHFF
ncbi:MAG: translocation/assembly module TamB domain-containing protein, partial [Planctomycetota bacterium]